MEITFTIKQITVEEATAENGYGNWGVKLNPGELIAYQCPILGYGGGADGFTNALESILAAYATITEADAEEGPDEIIFLSGTDFYYMEVTPLLARESIIAA